MARTQHDSRFHDALAAEIRAEMARRGVLQEELAEATGLSIDSIKRYVGKSSRPRVMDVNTLYAIAGALGVDPGDLAHAAADSLRKHDPAPPAADTETRARRAT